MRTGEMVALKRDGIAWISQKMLGHSEIAATLKFYTQFIKEKEQQHATFLNDERTTEKMGSLKSGK